MSAPTPEQICSDPCSFAFRPELFRQAVLVMLCNMNGAYGSGLFGNGSDGDVVISAPTTRALRLLLLELEFLLRVRFLITARLPITARMVIAQAV